MTSPILHHLVFCDHEDGCEAMANKLMFDENGNILPKSTCNDEGAIHYEGKDRKDLKFLISHHIEKMAVPFSGECAKYIRKLVSFKNFTNESTCEYIEIFVNVFIKCVKCCLQRTNDFMTLSKLRDSIESVLIFVNSVREATRNGQVEKNSLSYKIYVVFGLLLDVELLASRYEVESIGMIQDRLLKYIDTLLEGLDNTPIAIFYSTEFLNSSTARSYTDIRPVILEKMISKDLPIASKILLLKLWKRFPSDLRAENIVNDFAAQKIRDEDNAELRKLSSIFTTVPKNCENIAELCAATKVNLTEAVREYLKTQEELSFVNFTAFEVESLDGFTKEETNCCHVDEESVTFDTDPQLHEDGIHTVPISSVDSEHDYCCRSTSNGTERSSESSESVLPEEWPVELSEDEYSRMDERVEIELCDLCVELGTLAIDSCATETAPRTIRSFASSDLLNENDISPSEEAYFTDSVYQLHFDTCEADEKCFSQQYEYIMACQNNVNVESDRLPEVTFSEGTRCQCLSCYNNLECLRMNLCMLTEYAQKRKEKIEELTAIHKKPEPRVPPEYKRSASETLNYKLPLKKRKFSFDKA